MSNQDQRRVFMLEQLQRIDASFRIKTTAKDLKTLGNEWLRSFDGFPAATIEWAVSRWIDSGAEFAPRIGQLRVSIVVKALDLYEPDQALRHVQDTVKKLGEGYFDSDRKEAFGFLDDRHVERAVRAVGWDSIIEADTPAAKAAWRKHFLDAYGAVLARAQNVQTPVVVDEFGDAALAQSVGKTIAAKALQLAMTGDDTDTH